MCSPIFPHDLYGELQIYVLDAEPCMFSLVAAVVRSLHFYKKVQGGGHFPNILVVGVSHARRVTDDRFEHPCVTSF